MDLSLSSPKALDRAVGAAQRISEARRATLPILSHLLLDASDGISVTSTDLTTSISLRIPAEVVTPGRLAVSAQHLGQILRQLPDAPVSIVTKDAELTLTCERGRFLLRTLPADEFPAIPDAPQAGLRLPAATFRDLVRKTQFAVSHDESRSALTGIHIATADDCLRFTATDGHRLVRTSAPAPAPPLTVLVPLKALLAVARLSQSEDGDLELALDDEAHQLHLHYGTTRLTSRLIDGQFPDVNGIFGQPGEQRITVAREALHGALRRISPLAGAHHGVTLRSAGSTLTLSGSNELGEAVEELDATIAGTPPPVAFNGEYLIDFLEATEAEQVQFALTDPLSPVRLEPVGDPGFEHIVMPIRLA